MNRSALITVNVQGIGPEAAEHGEGELFGRLGHGRYAYRCGLTRILDVLKTMSIPATFFWPWCEARRVPALLERCLADGHEIASHGRNFEDHERLEPAREAEILEEAHAGLRGLTGVKPIGFRAPTGSMSAATLRILTSLGYRYDSSFVDDDAPYALDDDGGCGMIELPRSEGLTDATYFRYRLTQQRAETHFIEQLDALVPIAGYACVTVHPRADIGLARSSRLAILEHVIRRTQAHGAVFRLCRELVNPSGQQ